MSFPEETEKRIPRTLRACTATDATVLDLYIWSDRVEKWGGIVLLVLIVVGFLVTIVETVAQIDVNEEMVIPTLITSVVSWGLTAFLTYCAYQVTALLLRAMAKITHHTMIAANVALYESNKEENEREEQPKAPVVTVGKAGKWACPECGNVLAYDIIRCKCGFERKSGWTE